MLNKISSSFIILLCIAAGLGLTYITSQPDTIVKQERSPFSYYDKVIKFCLDEKNKNSKLCIVENPKNEKEVENAVKDSIEQDAVRNGSESSTEPIVVKSESERVEEQHTNTERTINTSSTSQPSQNSDPEPEPETRQIEVPEVPEIPEVPALKAPKVDIPELDVPEVPETGSLLDDVVTAGQ